MNPFYDQDDDDTMSDANPYTSHETEEAQKRSQTRLFARPFTRDIRITRATEDPLNDDYSVGDW